MGPMGNGIPMRPVEQTRIVVRRHAQAVGGQPAHALGIGSSAVPVAALALPLLTTTAAACPAEVRRWSRLTCTGAAQARLDVKVAAVGRGAPVGGGHEGEVEGARGLDAAGDPGGHEARGRGDAHG